MIAVDACLGRIASVGCIDLLRGPLRPGAGVHKDLPEVGHVAIEAVVNLGGFMEYFVPQNTRLHVVASMAEVIAEGVALALQPAMAEAAAAAG